MALVLLMKKIILLFLLISASLLSTSLAGRRHRFANKPADDARGAFNEEVSEEVDVDVHERLLKANAKDYGNYDPAPALGKPPSKLIPN